MARWISWDSVRTKEWRYTEWATWNGTSMLPIWDKLAGVELYDHRSGAGWGLENENVVEDAKHTSVVKDLSARLRAHFGRSPAPVSQEFVTQFV